MPTDGDSTRPHGVLKFGLNVAGREMEASARVPLGPVQVMDVLPVLHGIVSMIVAARRCVRRIVLLP